MASRYRSISRPVLSFLNHARTRSASPLLSSNPSFLLRPRSPSVSRELGALCTLLPLHSAVSSARLISRLGIDASGSSSSRSLSQGGRGEHGLVESHIPAYIAALRKLHLMMKRLIKI